MTATLVVAAAAAAAAAFVDPLNTPAVLSSAALKSETMAVTAAGQRLIAVGPGGRILVSGDRGRTWQQVACPVSSDLVAVQFPTAQVGWAVGHDGVVLQSTDGGRSWKKRLDGRDLNTMMLAKYERLASAGGEQAAADLKDARMFSEEGPAKPILDVWFRDEQEGYLVGAFNLIFHTADGGAHWEPWYERTDNPQRFHLNAIRGDGDAVFIVGEQGLVLRLDREHQRFVAVPFPYRGSLFGVAVQRDAVVVGGLRGNALRSLDGGRTWSTLTETTGATYTGAAALNGGGIVLVDVSGKVLMSSSAAGAFAPLPQVPAGRIFGVAAAANGTIALAGDGGVRVVALK
jgi:photosystem II stability/assembly factor-like uncharacterized protein